MVRCAVVHWKPRAILPSPNPTAQRADVWVKLPWFTFMLPLFGSLSCTQDVPDDVDADTRWFLGLCTGHRAALAARFTPTLGASPTRTRNVLAR